MRVLLVLGLALLVVGGPSSLTASAIVEDVGGMRHYVLPDGFEMWTHGPDMLPPETEWDFSPRPVAPACVQDPATQHHGHVLYAHPVGRPNRYLTDVIPRLRENISLAAGFMDATAARYGASSTLWMRCDADGQVTVSYVEVPSGGAGYEDFVYAIRNAGFRDPLAKYWVMYDRGSSSGAAGEAMVPTSSQPGVGHPSNTQGPWYGLTYMSTHWTTMLHEGAHTMGAVQTDAPHATSTHHCTDGEDLMCYEGGTDFNVCPIGRAFDCNGDDYFHPAPPPGNYLATHWNLGHADNLFVKMSPTNPRPAAPSGLTATRGPGLGEVTLAWDATTWPGGGAPEGYRVLAQDQNWPHVVGETSAEARSFVATGLDSSTTYAFVVLGFNAAGEGGLSDDAWARTFAVPGAPRDLRATSGVQKVNLLFLPPLDDGGRPITRYRAIVDHYPIGGPAFERDLNVGTLPTGQLNAVVWMPDTGTYNFRVVAVNEVGQGARSNNAVSGALAP